jgi:signal peptidase II
VPELQAARGASLSASEASGSSTPAGPPAASGHTSGDDRPAGTVGGRPAARLAFVVAAVALAVDVVSKQLAVRELTGRAPVDVVGDLLQLRLLRNPGAAFSAGASLTPLITVVAIVAAVVVVFYAFRARHRGWAVALGLLLAGVTGNLGDRLFRSPGPFRGHVVDFFALPNWPVFNVADICIDVAGALFVYLLVRGVHLDGSRPPHVADRDQS